MTENKKPMLELILASHNANKVKEIQAVMPEHVSLKSLAEIACFEDIPETEDTLEGNALLKARFVYKHYQRNCFADDTGLEIEALNGEPGVFSARYAGQERSDEKNMDLVLKRLENQSNRNAQFRTVIALIVDGDEFLFEGIVPGEIRTAKQGDQGFGYDPIFEPEGCGKTFAELSFSEKNIRSHRGRAVEKMAKFLNEIK